MPIIKLGSPDVYRQSGASISYIEGLLSAAIPDVSTHRKNADAGFLYFLVRPRACEYDIPGNTVTVSGE